MLFGIPLVIWGVVCLVIAVVYYVVGPRLHGDRPRPVWAAIALRYFHSLVWLLLAATCFLWGAGDPAPARLCALLAGLFYVVFVVAYLRYGPRRREQSRE